MQFPGSNRFGMPGQPQWNSFPANGRQASGTQSTDGSGDIQAWLQFAYGNQLGAQQPQTNTAIQPVNNSTGIQGINSGMSIQDLQGRVQTTGSSKTKGKGKGKTGATDPAQDMSDQIKQLTQSVMAKKQAASQANAMGMPEQAMAQLKAAFGEIASVQQALNKNDGQNQGQAVSATAANSNVKQTLQGLMNSVTQQAAGVMQSQGVMLQPKDIENLMMDGFNKKNAKPGAKPQQANQSQLTRQRLNEQVESLLQCVESNPQDAKRNLKAIKSILVLMQDFGNINNQQARVQVLENPGQTQQVKQNPFTKKV